MDEESNWKTRHDDWIRRAGKIQAVIIAERGMLDQREYRRRLEETGMMEEWQILQSDPAAIKPTSMKGN